MFSAPQCRFRYQIPIPAGRANSDVSAEGSSEPELGTWDLDYFAMIVDRRQRPRIKMRWGLRVGAKRAAGVGPGKGKARQREGWTGPDQKNNTGTVP
jgi:hypothetical protein